MNALERKIETNRRELRKRDIQEFFHHERQRLSWNSQHQEEQLFQSIYPLLDTDNYAQHKHALTLFASSNKYDFMLVSFACLAYDYLLEHPHDKDSLNLIEVLSDFEEIEIPQTEELAQFLKGNLPRNPVQILTIMCNLLSLSRYKEILRDRLLEGDICAAITTLDASETVDYLAATAYCLMMSSHPMVHISIACFLVQKIALLIRCEDCKPIIAQLFEQIEQSFTPNEQLAAALHEKFRCFIHKQYRNFEGEFLSLFMYLSRSKQFLNTDEEGSLVSSLSSAVQENKEKALTCVQTILETREARYISAQVLNPSTTLKIVEILEVHCGESLQMYALKALEMQVSAQVECGVVVSGFGEEQAVISGLIGGMCCGRTLVIEGVLRVLGELRVRQSALERAQRWERVAGMEWEGRAVGQWCLEMAE